MSDKSQHQSNDQFPMATLQSEVIVKIASFLDWRSMISFFQINKRNHLLFEDYQGNERLSALTVVIPTVDGSEIRIPFAKVNHLLKRIYNLPEIVGCENRKRREQHPYYAVGIETSVNQLNTSSICISVGIIILFSLYGVMRQGCTEIFVNGNYIPSVSLNLISNEFYQGSMVSGMMYCARSLNHYVSYYRPWNSIEATHRQYHFDATDENNLERYYRQNDAIRVKKCISRNQSAFFKTAAIQIAPDAESNEKAIEPFIHA